jgi:hypothetical protein
MWQHPSLRTYRNRGNLEGKVVLQKLRKPWNMEQNLRRRSASEVVLQKLSKPRNKPVNTGVWNSVFGSFLLVVFAVAVFAQGKPKAENKDLNGYLLVYTGFGKGADRGRRMAAFAVNDLVRNYHVPRTRLRAVYAGHREQPEIEFWLVPKGQGVSKATQLRQK